MKEILQLGGPVLWLEFLLGLLALCVFLERSLSLHRARVDATDFLQGIFNAVKRGNANEAAALCEETPGPVARLALVAVRRGAETSGDRLAADLEAAGRDESARLRRRLSTLALAARIAPLLGLLGTAAGLFRAVSIWRAALPYATFAGVADSLLSATVTTVAGLAIAIPTHVAHSVLADKVDRLELDMRAAASECTFFFNRIRAGGGHGA